MATRSRWASGRTAGFSVLTYNSRARVPSGGRYVTVGALEQKDVVSVVNYAVGRRDVDANRIGILGISMGELPRSWRRRKTSASAQS